MSEFKLTWQSPYKYTRVEFELCDTDAPCGGTCWTLIGNFGRSTPEFSAAVKLLFNVWHSDNARDIGMALTRLYKLHLEPDLEQDDSEPEQRITQVTGPQVIHTPDGDELRLEEGFYGMHFDVGASTVLQPVEPPIIVITDGRDS